jgi:enterochelin esterase-like enzyme
VWTYTFNVDGTRMLDPGNVYVQRDGARYLNMLLVPGEGSALYDEGDEAHGTIDQVWYPSPTLHMARRRMYVYTPAGYEGSKEKYPVLYLLHGAGGDEDAWDNMGRAHEIMDHLIASGKAKPMLVVMTNGNWNQIAAPGVSPQAPPPPGGTNQITVPGQITPAMEFSESVVADVIPFVEKNYRVLTDRDHRAIAGLSMGGAQTLYAGLNHLDKFSYVASFSGALTMWPGARKMVPAPEGSTQQGPPKQALALEGVAATFPKIDASANAKLHLLYISCGMDDGLLSVDQKFMDWLTSKGVTYKKVLTPGYAHQWSFWRISLADYASQLFSSAPTAGSAKTAGR